MITVTDSYGRIRYYLVQGIICWRLKDALELLASR